MKKETSYLSCLMWIIVAVLFNVALSFLVQKVLEIPLVYMDTVGTIAISFAFGCIPGLITAIISQLFYFVVFHYVSWIGFLYSLSVWGAVFVVAAFLKKLINVKAVLSKIVILALISIVMCFVVSIIGGLVNTFSTMYNNLHNIPSDISVQIESIKGDFIRSGFKELPANILSRIPGNLIERPVTTFSAYGIVVLIKKIYRKKSINK